MNRRLQANTILHLNKSMSQILVHSLTKTGLLPSYCYLALPYLFLSLSSSYSNIRSGVPYRIRTCDLLLRRQLLYPAELRERICLCFPGCHQIWWAHLMGISPTQHLRLVLLVVGARIELAPRDGSLLSYTELITSLLYLPCNTLWPLRVTKGLQRPTD